MEDYINFTSRYSGLTELQAVERIEMYGYNNEAEESDEEKVPFPVWKIFISFRFWLMIIASLIFAVNLQIDKTVILMSLLCIYVITEIYKCKKCNESGKHFHDRDAFEVSVIRGGEVVSKNNRFLVPDDIVILGAGESVPADLHILECDNLIVDESLFTGDDSSVQKQAGVDSKNELKQSCVYKGTRIISGIMVGRVFAAGVDTYRYKTFGEGETDSLNRGASSVMGAASFAFEQIIAKIIPVLNIAAAAFLVVVAVLTFNPDISSGIATLVAGTFLPAISFALCFIPAETICIIRIYHLETVSRLKKRQMAIRDFNTFESLNAMTAVCIDKSGIIAAHRIAVAEEFSGNIEMLINVSVLSCDVDPDSDLDFDRAISLHAALRQTDIKDLHKNELIKSYPFSKEENMGGNLWNVNGVRLFCIKGEPENIYTVCHIQHDELFQLQERQLTYSRQGQQVLAIAYARIEGDEIPESIYDAQFKALGLISFMNPYRDSIPMAVRNCYKAGVDVIMFTDDSADVATAIASKIGIAEKRIITGEQLRNSILNGEKPNLKDVNIYAAITNDQKNDIVRLLRKSGEIVGVISDNTADVKLLELADIGVLVIEDSTTAVQQASDILLNNDDFGGFVDAVKETRQAHSNIKSAVTLSLCSTMILIMFSGFNLLFGGEFIFNEITSSLILIGVIPFCSFAYINNKSEIKLMQQASDFIGRGKVNRGFFIKAAMQSASLLVFMLLVYYMTYEFGDGGRGYIFITFISGLLMMKWVNMSDSVPVFRAIVKNEGGALIITGIVLLISLLLLYLPYVNIWFGFSDTNPLIVLLSITLGTVSQLWYEFIKRSNYSKG